MPILPARPPRLESAPDQQESLSLRLDAKRPLSRAPIPDGPEEALLAFDPAADLESIVVMPGTIPSAVRNAITRALEDRFESAEALNVWLYGQHKRLEGLSPFEALIGGAGVEVLAVLIDEVPHINPRGQITERHCAPRRTLRLVR